MIPVHEEVVVTSVTGNGEGTVEGWGGGLRVT